MVTSYHVLLIETGANQSYLFETNKLAESVGGSELIHRVTNEFAIAALAAALPSGLDGSAVRLESDGVEVLVKTAGKFIVLFRDEDKARSVLYSVTERALVEAPGLEVYGAVAGPFEWGNQLHDAIAAVHRQAGENRVDVAARNIRFLRLPIVTDCETSGLPAAAYGKDRETFAARSHAVWAKLGCAHRARSGKAVGAVKIVKNLEELEKRFEGAGIDGDAEAWIAVIHADGNGFGKLVIGFDQSLPAGVDDRVYADAYRSFSRALETVAETALQQAMDATWGTDIAVPLIPLIVGGDDLTVICEGARAMKFAREYLLAFEEAASAETAISDRAAAFPDMKRLTAAAGIAFTKPHFPFSLGYRLAEELTASAKQTKARNVVESSFDFHVLLDSIGNSLDTIRERMRSPEGDALWGGPYIVSSGTDHAGSAATDAWVAPRRFSRLEAAVEALNRTDDDGRRLLPSTQMHRLRAALWLPRGEREAMTKEMRRHYDLDPLLDNGQVIAGSGDGAHSLFLDAIALADIERDAAKVNEEVGAK